MELLPTRLEGLVLVQPVVHGDHRGFFHESYRRDRFAELGVDCEFVQDNHSRSVRGVVRGLHYQVGQAKLVRCGYGSILDVVVDVRRGSPTFGEWEAVELDDKSLRQLFVPDGFAHGFATLSESADVMYKVSSYYDASLESGINHADPDLGIEWPPGLVLVPSERDANAPSLAEVADGLPFAYGQ